MENDTNIGAAILGFYAAIKICVRKGHDPADVYRVVKQFLDDNPEHYKPEHDKLKKDRP